jgi:hypothetical protein
MKTGTATSVPLKMGLGAQNMKTGHGVLGIAENRSGSAKYENKTHRPRYRRNRVRECKTSKRDPTPSVPKKTSPVAQNMKTSPDALGTDENKSGSTKYDNGTQRLGTAEHGSRSAKHEKETRCPRYR